MSATPTTSRGVASCRTCRSLPVLSDALGHTVRLRLTPRGIKTIEHNGGIDPYLLGTNDSKLTRDEGAEAPRRVGQGQKDAKAAAAAKHLTFCRPESGGGPRGRPAAQSRLRPND